MSGPSKQSTDGIIAKGRERLSPGQGLEEHEVESIYLWICLPLKIIEESGEKENQIALVNGVCEWIFKDIAVISGGKK